MATKSEGFNLTAAIRQYQQSHRLGSANEALAAIKSANRSQKINESTFRATFSKLRSRGSRGKRKVVRRRKPGQFTVVGSGNHAEATLKAGLQFIRLAGGVEQARERLVGLEELIETARSVE